MFAGAAGNPRTLPFRSAEWRIHGASTITGCCFPDAGRGMSSTNSTQVHRVFPGRRPRARGRRSGGAAPGRIVKVAAEAVEPSPLPRTDCAQVHGLRRGRAHGAPPEPRRQLRSGWVQGQRRARRIHADGTVGEGVCRMSLDLNALRKRRQRVGSSCAVIER